jgi:hypothetical protein
MGRDRRYGGRGASMKTRVGIATAVVVGGAAIGVAAVAATSHSATPAAAAKSAGYTLRFGNEWNTLNTAMNSWQRNQQSSYSALSSWTQQTFSQAWQNNRMLAVQRGIVVLATNKFVILQSTNGSLRLWLLSGNTQFQNVSNTTTGTTALTASTSAAQQAMSLGNMIPATTILAGSPLTARNFLTPTVTPQTVKVVVAGTSLTVTVTVTGNTATVNQTASMPQNAFPWWAPSTTTLNAWTTPTAAVQLARGDLALIAGTRSHNLLHAQLVLFTPLTTNDMGTITCPGTGTGTGTSTGTGTGTTVPSSAGSSGTHT